MFIISFLIGFFTGALVVSALVDIIFFDIPFTLKLRKTNIINAYSILSGSIVSFFLWSAILFIISFLFSSFFFDDFNQFVISLLIGSIWIVLKKKKKLLTELYFNKHINNVAPTMRIMLYNQEGFDYEGVKEYLNSLLRFYDQQIK